MGLQFRGDLLAVHEFGTPTSRQNGTLRALFCFHLLYRRIQGVIKHTIGQRNKETCRYTGTEGIIHMSVHSPVLIALSATSEAI